MMKVLGVVALAFFFANTASAVVDMKNANYASTFTDLVVPGSGFDLKVQRTYNSRSLFNGSEGFGWCSEFKTTLEVTAEGNFRVTECGGGLEVTYTPKNYDIKRVNVTISKIIAEVKKRNRDLRAPYFKRLKKELTENTSLRKEFSQQLKLKGPVVPRKVYYANGRETENVVYENGKYKRSLEDGTFQLFDKSGHLIAMYDLNGNHLKLNWKNHQLTSVVDNNGRQLSFAYYRNKIKKISGPNGIVAKYKFDGEDLIEVSNAWGNTFKYKYDDNHNLVKIIYPDKTYKELTYNKDKDWVTRFKNRKGCIENYTYHVDKEDPKDHYWSTVEKRCGKKVTNKSTYEFFHRKRKDGLGKYLYRVRTDNNGSISEIVYHEVFGKPISVLKNKSKVKFSYYLNGLIKTKEEDLRLLKFKFKNHCQKPSKVKITYYKPKVFRGKKKRRGTRHLSSAKKTVAHKATTVYRYDKKKCNLVYAKNSSGQIAKIQYDNRGRMAIIEDQSKKIVKIQYEERFGKPSRVERPGLGTLRVTYKSDGNVKKVTSKEGVTVAVQVATILNNLLEIIAPATSETSI